MYTDADFTTIRAQKMRRLYCAFAFLALAIATMVVGATIRIELLCTLGAALFACLFYAVLELFAMPYVRYDRFLRDMQEGLSRTMDGYFLHVSTEPRMSDGVLCYDFIVSESETEQAERLFYFDADKTLPTLSEGQKLRITSFGNYITQIENA